VRTIGALFAGTGGLDLAAERVWNARVVWYAETNPTASRLLAQRFPDATNLGDVTTIDWADVEWVDVLTGGFPCQDISSAGRGRGMGAGTRSGLWLSMVAAIETLQPRIVVTENVRGILSRRGRTGDVAPCPTCLGDRPDHYLRALGTVLGDLASIRYDARWRCLEAAQVGAPHHRLRWFCVAHPNDVPLLRAADPRPARIWQTPMDALLPTPTPFHSDNTETPARWLERRADVQARTGTRHGIALPVVARSMHERALIIQDGTGPHLVPVADDAHPWGPYEQAVDRWADVRGEPPWPVRAEDHSRLNDEFVEWMMGYPRGWVTHASDVSWKQALRLLGNGVVPEQAEEALRSLLALGP
jgi:DNA (cytosine-5)-methyltransferase 1